MDTAETHVVPDVHRKQLPRVREVFPIDIAGEHWIIELAPTVTTSGTPQRCRIERDRRRIRLYPAMVPEAQRMPVAADAVCRAWRMVLAERQRHSQN